MMAALAPPTSHLCEYTSVTAVCTLPPPLPRWIYNQVKNRVIAARNESREEAAEQLSRPNPRLASKLASARREGEVKLIGKQDIVFSTAEEGGAGRLAAEREAGEWERRLAAQEAQEVREMPRGGQQQQVRKEEEAGW